MKHFNFIYLISFLLILGACKDDDLFLQGGSNGNGYDGLPVEFEFILPEETLETRTVENPKTSFSVGDVIHIQGTFETQYEGETATVVRYGALRKISTGWEPVEGNGLTWPTTATEGQFTAYWISESTSVLHPDSVPLSAKLSTLTSQTDPLGAVSQSGIPYGHAVPLQFNHLCTYLTLMELEPMVSDSYWITTDSIPGVAQINNAFQLSLSSENQLNFEFIATPDPAYNNLVYVEGAAINVEVPDTASVNGLRTITQANYFLQPGDYTTFILRYPAVAPRSYEYMKYDFNNIPENVGGENDSNIAPELEAGKSYVLNVTTSPGITIVAPPSAEEWDESDNYETIEDVKSFLEAISTGADYSERGVDILRKTATGTELLRNVDFHFEEYTIWEDSNYPDGYYQPNIREGSVFNGGFHYIRNIGSPVFRYNYGTIRDLGIKNLNMSFISDENDETQHDMSRKGSLVCWNETTGTIQNVRITGGGEINAYVKPGTGEENEDSDSGATQETHNIGCIVGSNTGNVNGVEMGGTFTLTVTGFNGYPDVDSEPEMEVNVTVLTGGFVGQNAGTGNITEVNAYENNLTINIINTCKSSTTGAFYTGGIAGQSSAYITSVIIPQVNVDCSQNTGFTLYSGGIAGELTTDINNITAAVANCVVGGSVKAGVSRPYGGTETGESVTYTGGISGALQSVPVTASRVSVSVYGPENAINNVTYATGGAFGRIRTTSDVSNLVAYGSALTGPDPAIGNFAGMVPTGQTWQTDYADKNIVVRTFSSDGTPYENIGSTL